MNSVGMWVWWFLPEYFGSLHSSFGQQRQEFLTAVGHLSAFHILLVIHHVFQLGCNLISMYILCTSYVPGEGGDSHGN